RIRRWVSSSCASASRTSCSMRGYSWARSLPSFHLPTSRTSCSSSPKLSRKSAAVGASGAGRAGGGAAAITGGTDSFGDRVVVMTLSPPLLPGERDKVRQFFPESGFFPFANRSGPQTPEQGVLPNGRQEKPAVVHGLLVGQTEGSPKHLRQSYPPHLPPDGSCP